MASLQPNPGGRKRRESTRGQAAAVVLPQTPFMSSAHWADRILAALDHIHAHLDEQDLEPKQLAELSGFSLHHFHRVFRGMVGESVMGYVRRLRLERAAFRLRHAGGEVTAVAFSFGYESHEAFTRAFRAHFGVPPRVYRAQQQGSSAEGVAANLREEPSRCLWVRPYVGPYEGCGAAWGALMGLVQERGLPALGPAMGLVHDDPEITAPDRCRYDAGWIVRATQASPPPGFAVREIPAGLHAVALHRGPYSEILDTYVGLLGRWLPRQSLELADAPVVELYLDAPGSVPEAEQRTEVAVRIA